MLLEKALLCMAGMMKCEVPPRQEGSNSEGARKTEKQVKSPVSLLIIKIKFNILLPGKITGQPVDQSQFFNLFLPERSSCQRWNCTGELISQLFSTGGADLRNNRWGRGSCDRPAFALCLDCKLAQLWRQ